MQACPQDGARAGFTMVEIVVVLVLIGVLSAVAAGMRSSVAFAREAREAEQLRMDLRYAQQLAMAATNDVLFRINADGDWYQVPAGMVFANGLQRIELESDLTTSPNVTFRAQTGLPSREVVYYLGDSQLVEVNGTTGLVQ